MKNIHKIILAISITVIIVIGTVVAMIYRVAFVPIDATAETTIRYTIEPGTTPHRITQDLADQGLITNPTLANLVIRVKGWSHIQAGEYEISKSLSLAEMFQLFETGEIAQARHRITIPEGERLTFIADIMAPATELTSDELIDAWSDPEFLKTLIEEYWFLTDEILNEDIYYPLEGYFYPLTYEFRDEFYSVEDLTRMLLDVTEQRLETLRESIENSDFTVHEILTLAAIVEGETQDVTEMANVSGVFHNRLDINMRLQTDVTVTKSL